MAILQCREAYAWYRSAKKIIMLESFKNPKHLYTPNQNF